MEYKWKDKSVEGFRKFAEGQIWKSDDNVTAFMGVDNVSRWWEAFISSTVIPEIKEEVAREVEGMKNQRILVVGSSNAGKMKTIGYNQALDDILALLK